MIAERFDFLRSPADGEPLYSGIGRAEHRGQAITWKGLLCWASLLFYGFRQEFLTVANGNNETVRIPQYLRPWSNRCNNSEGEC